MINEIPVWDWDISEPGNIDPAADEVRFKIDDLLLSPGRNLISISAKTKLAKSYPIIEDIYSTIDTDGGNARGGGNDQDDTFQKVIPHLFVLSIGVSTYLHGRKKETVKKGEKGVLTHLNYADKDADAFEKQFKALEGNGFKKVHSIKLTNEQATTKNIKKAVLELGQKIEDHSRKKRKHKVYSRDVAVIFMAGHGKKGNKDNKFYFLSHDTNPKNIYNSAVDLIELGKTINKYQSEIVLLTDACQSGQLGENFNNRELTKELKEISGRAQVIFNATTANKPAYENKAWSHGAFAKGILDAMGVHSPKAFEKSIQTESKSCKGLA